jgi:pyruvate dehydrogenase E2 component (dihydrolipoamide acetyltransferase)
MAVQEARVPDIGNYSDVPVIELLVAVGDTVKKDQGLVTLESDKATMEVPAPFAGVVREIKVKVGDSLSEGSLVALIDASDGAAAPASPAAAPAPAPAATKAEPPAAATPAVAAAPAAVAAPISRAPSVDPEAAGPRTPPVSFDAAAVDPAKVPHASPRCACSRASWAWTWPRSAARAQGPHHA